MTEPDFDHDEEREPEAVEQIEAVEPVELPQRVHRGLEVDVDEGDALEQAREIDLNDDEER